jgi:hypothetical protein
MRFALLAVGILLIPFAIAQGQIAERPIWRVGDKWTYHQVAGLPPVESDWAREVVESLPNGEFAVRTENGRSLVFDAETNSLDSRGPEYSWKRFDFPLSVGKHWTYDRRIGGSLNDGYEKASWEVKAYEKLTVPAGTFDCFRVEGVVWRTQSQGVYTPSHFHQDMTYWYCPKVKWVAKWKAHSGGTFAAYVDGESVLTSYVAD